MFRTHKDIYILELGIVYSNNLEWFNFLLSVSRALTRDSWPSSASGVNKIFMEHEEVCVEFIN